MGTGRMKSKEGQDFGTDMSVVRLPGDDALFKIENRKIKQVMKFFSELPAQHNF